MLDGERIIHEEAEASYNRMINLRVLVGLNLQVVTFISAYLLLDETGRIEGLKLDNFPSLL